MHKNTMFDWFLEEFPRNLFKNSETYLKLKKISPKLRIFFKTEDSKMPKPRNMKFIGVLTHLQRAKKKPDLFVL